MPHLVSSNAARRIFQRPAGERQKRNVTGAFDGRGHHALVFGARAGLAARADLAFIGDVFPKQVRFFIVYDQIFVSAKLTEFWFGKEAALRWATFIVSMIFSHCLLHFLD
jgi:hypothetical protein